MVIDVAIIGGGIAGATAAYYLAKYGYQVELYEKELLAHHKVCGEYLSAETIEYLKELDINLSDYNASRINKFNLFSNAHQAFVQLDDEARGLSRYVLDELILNKAIEAGAVVRRGVKVNNYEGLAKHLIIATGKHDNHYHQRHGEDGFIGFKMYYSLDKVNEKYIDQEINIFLYKGGYAGLCYVENQVINLSLIIKKDIYKQYCKNYSGLVAYIRKQNKFLDKYLDKAVELLDKPLSVTNIPYGFIWSKAKDSKFTSSDESHHKQTRNVIDDKLDYQTIGDQFAVIPSLMGNGMAIAYLTGKQAAMNFHHQHTDEKNSVETLKLDHKIKLAYLIHRILNISFLADSLVMILKTSPWLMKYFIKQTRITLPINSAIMNLSRPSEPLNTIEISK